MMGMMVRVRSGLCVKVEHERSRAVQYLFESGGWQGRAPPSVTAAAASPSASPQLLHGGRDVLAQAGDGATVGGHEGVVALLRYGLARGRAARVGLAVPRAAHRPHRVQ